MTERLNTPPSILVVEDEMLVAMDIRNKLKALGYEVRGVVATGEEAIRRAEETRPDLVLMDIQLNGRINGVEAARVIRQQFRLPVVFLTAYHDSETLEQVKDVDPSGYLLKPFEGRHLRTAVELALAQEGRGRQRQQAFEDLALVIRRREEGTLVTDADGKLRLLNAGAESALGLREQDVLGEPLVEVLKGWGGVDRVRRFLAEQRESVAWGDTYCRAVLRGEAVVEGSSGERVGLELRALWDEGQLRGVWVTFGVWPEGGEQREEDVFTKARFKVEVARDIVRQLESLQRRRS